MIDPFHEAREALQTAVREFTSVDSLNTTATYATNQACENSFRVLWDIATGGPFPYEQFQPHHKVSVWAHTVGIYASYSPESQIFLDKLEGWALDQVRHIGTQAYIDHIKPTAAYRGREIIRGTQRFVEETEALARKPEVLEMLKSYQSKLKAT
jgi:hypothetical protein